MALAHGVRQGLALRYWEASLVWKGVRDHARITNFEELIDELADLRPQLWQVGNLAELMLKDVIEDVRRRHIYEARIYAWDRSPTTAPIVTPTTSAATECEPQTMVN
jgi:hypothetical protein